MILSTQCKRNIFQYPPLAVPIPSALGIAMTADLGLYTDGAALGASGTFIRAKVRPESVPQVKD